MPFLSQLNYDEEAAKQYLTDIFKAVIIKDIVYNALVKKGYRINIGRIRSAEIDFVCEKYGEKLYVQVCYLLASQATIDREFNNLKKVDDMFPKIVVSMDELDFSRDGIKHFHIIDFLESDQF